MSKKKSPKGKGGTTKPTPGSGKNTKSSGGKSKAGAKPAPGSAPAPDAKSPAPPSVALSPVVQATPVTNEPGASAAPSAAPPTGKGAKKPRGGKQAAGKDPARQIAEESDRKLAATAKSAAPAPAEAHAPAHGERPRDMRYTAALTLGALGVVYGDIGTSPLYALRECFAGPHEPRLPLERESILGVLSLIFWSLMIVISIKYLSYVMRADNRGEGGVLALMALAQPTRSSRWGTLIILSGLFGSALLYGDGMITPAISVLSAIEGIEIVTPALKDWVVPITIAIIIGLFLPQRHGTGRLGSFFGPLILTWFVVIGILGLVSLLRYPDILAAINPIYAARMFAHHPMAAFHSLGSVFLVVTGGEALYADMGHFGRGPIRLGWFLVALPGLALNYFGQGALLLHDPTVVENPFYHLAPKSLTLPLVILSTSATVIASQAVISGAFSLTRQAVQLGYLPRLEISHTSSREIGQIYVPYINWALLIAAVALVLGFKTSSNLAAAYGVAVTTTMGITTVLVFLVARQRWKWSLAWLVPVTIIFLIIDLSFFGANILKVPDGGWFPLAVAGAGLTLMTTWRRGRELLGKRMRERLVPLNQFLKSIEDKTPLRVPGTAVFMTGGVDFAPPALVHNLRHNHALHQNVIIMRVITEERPHIGEECRFSAERVGDGIYTAVARYGFMDSPDAPAALTHAEKYGLKINLNEMTYFLGRETLIPTKRPGMALWREKLFGFISRNAQSATAFFKIPPDQVVEIGIQVEL